MISEQETAPKEQESFKHEKPSRCCTCLDRCLKDKYNITEEEYICFQQLRLKTAEKFETHKHFHLL